MLMFPQKHRNNNGLYRERKNGFLNHVDIATKEKYIWLLFQFSFASSTQNYRCCWLSMQFMQEKENILFRLMR